MYSEFDYSFRVQLFNQDFSKIFLGPENGIVNQHFSDKNK
jgi:hypothetical protein